LIVPLANLSISGGLQREIEGDRVIIVRDANGNVRFVNLDDIRREPQAQVVNITKSLHGTIPKDYSLEIAGNPFPPSDWKPPDKNFTEKCGVDLTDYFAKKLFLEMIMSFYFDERRRLFNENPSISQEDFSKKIEEFEKRTPILKNAKGVAGRVQEIEDKLREGGCNFHPDGTSVFTDYKWMRARAYLKAGRYGQANLSAEEYARIWNKDQALQTAWKKGAQIIEKSFNENMTTEEALRVAKGIIEKFWW